MLIRSCFLLLSCNLFYVSVIQIFLLRLTFDFLLTLVCVCVCVCYSWFSCFFWFVFDSWFLLYVTIEFCGSLTWRYSWFLLDVSSALCVALDFRDSLDFLHYFILLRNVWSVGYSPFCVSSVATGLTPSTRRTRSSTARTATRGGPTTAGPPWRRATATWTPSRQEQIVPLKKESESKFCPHIKILHGPVSLMVVVSPCVFYIIFCPNATFNQIFLYFFIKNIWNWIFFSLNLSVTTHWRKVKLWNYSIGLFSYINKNTFHK